MAIETDSAPETGNPSRTADETTSAAPMSAGRIAGCLLGSMAFAAVLYFFPFKAAWRWLMVVAAYDLRLTACVGVGLLSTAVCIRARSDSRRDRSISGDFELLGTIILFLATFGAFAKHASDDTVSISYTEMLQDRHGDYQGLVSRLPRHLENLYKTGSGEKWSNQDTCRAIVEATPDPLVHYTMTVNGKAPSMDACGTGLNILRWGARPSE